MVYFFLLDLKGARVVTLTPGQVLFVPRHWWHYVENVDSAISINTWIPLVSHFICNVRKRKIFPLVFVIRKNIN